MIPSFRTSDGSPVESGGRSRALDALVGVQLKAPSDARQQKACPDKGTYRGNKDD